MPMRISGGLRVEKLARQARSEWPESEDVEDVDAVDATLGDRECSDRLLLRLGGLIWGASVSSNICGVLPSIWPNFALERSSCARCA